jgi:hypothetical protein
MKARITFTVLILLAAVGAAPAQVWVKKEPAKWSKDDCKKIMEDSPWADKFTLSTVREEAFVADSSYGTGREANPRIDFIAQLRSAAPIRQAQVRLSQIDNKYDRMTAEQKAQFDAFSQRYLQQTFEDRIVVVIEMRSNVEIYMRQLVEMWSSINEGAVPVDAYLVTSDGKRIPPVHFVRPTHGNPAMQLTFPRQTSEGAVVNADDKEFVIEIPGIRLDEINERILRFHFRPQKMTYQGKFAM